MKYSDKQILDRLKSLKSYKDIPDYLLVGIRSNKDSFDVFDDKMYLFVRSTFKLVASCTLNPGGPSLLGGWKKYNKYGAAITKADEIYYDAFKYGLHNGKMPALRQVKPLKYYRDGNNDRKVDESGQIFEAIYNTNIHFNSYNLYSKLKTSIGEWSQGCFVLNESDKYLKMIELTKNAPAVTLAIIKEF